MMGEIEVREITASLAREVVERKHYLHRKPSVSFPFGLFRADELVGVCTFGVPAGRAVKMSACPGYPEAVVELNRLWVHDSMPKLTESWFVGQCLRRMPARIVVSYADTREGHLGIIYRALNFKYAGWTDMDRDYQCYDYRLADGRYTSKSEPWTPETGMKVARLPKVRYWITTGNAWERRWLAKCCAWTVMDWNEVPPPVVSISLSQYMTVCRRPWGRHEFNEVHDVGETDCCGDIHSTG